MQTNLSAGPVRQFMEGDPVVTPSQETMVDGPGLEVHGDPPEPLARTLYSSPMAVASMHLHDAMDFTVHHAVEPLGRALAAARDGVGAAGQALGADAATAAQDLVYGYPDDVTGAASLVAAGAAISVLAGPGGAVVGAVAVTAAAAAALALGLARADDPAQAGPPGGGVPPGGPPPPGPPGGGGGPGPAPGAGPPPPPAAGGPQPPPPGDGSPPGSGAPELTSRTLARHDYSGQGSGGADWRPELL
ncbi:MAG: hypothetical protein ACAI34_02565 [Verrucomicrobium sp.]